ncbi:MAG: hypothetical protein ACKV2U_30820 [Bryobacteraceae bacterium]
MKWVNATDIKLWAGRLDSQSLMPELLRRLVFASIHNPHRVEFPSAESVQSGGWDGISEVSEQSTFVPFGPAGWELGTKKHVKAKADSDYEKRSAKPAPLDPGRSTFVFVTPRAWSKKSQWAMGKLAEGRWASVRGYNADDLEAWIDLHPGVGAWFANRIGKYPTGVQSLDDLWEEYAYSTSPPLSSLLLLSGREAEATRLREWHLGQPSVLVVEGDSLNEAAAFVAAVANTAPEHERAQIFGRTIVGTTHEALSQITRSAKDLTILWKYGDVSAVGSVVARGHRVLIPLGKGGSTGEGDHAVIALPRPAKEAFIAALQSCGVEEDRARFLASKTARSITVLQRRIPAAGLYSRPTWAVSGNAQLPIPILLAGSWINTREGDREVVKTLAKTEYAEIERTMAASANFQDPPVRKIGEQWSLVSPLDAWQLLSSLLTRDDLDRFQEVCLSVLGSDDPALTLDAKDRWAGSAYGKEFAQSGVLRSALAQSLALLSVVVHEACTTAGNLESYVHHIVCRLLEDAPDWRRWYSLSHVLPLLAESAPDAFLRALEGDLARQEPFVVALFQDKGDFGGSPHPGLLWALETLAWFPAHLGRVSVALAKLARLDPGGKLSNRPRNSLWDIFLSWKPHTAATLQQRLQVIDLVLMKEEAVGWHLLLDLLPKSHTTTSGTAKPRWREIPEMKPVTLSERLASEIGIVERAVDRAHMRAERLAELVSHNSGFPPSGRKALSLRLDEVAEHLQDASQRVLLWNALRVFIIRHRRFVGSEWALPEVEIRALDELLTRLEPEDLIEQSKWLFSDWLLDMPGTHGDHRQREHTAEALRMAAIKKTLDIFQIAGVYRLAQSVAYPGLVGKTLAGMDRDGAFALELVDRCLGSDDGSLRILGMSFVSEYTKLNASKAKLVEIEARLSTLNARAQGDFYLALPTDLQTWDVVDAAAEGVRGHYWSHLQWFPVASADPATTQRAIERFLEFGRSIEAIQVAAHKAKDLPLELLVAVLDALGGWLNEGKLGKHNSSHHPSYDVGQILDELRSRADVARSEMVRLEWFFLPFLDHGGTTSAPTLQEALMEDPVLFAQMIRWTYRPQEGKDGDEQEPRTEQDRLRAGQSDDLLRSLRRVPGSGTEGGLDWDRLITWVVRVRAECKESGHASIGDHLIGEMLAWAPQGPDGIWPHQSVRKLLEELESKEVESGLAIGVFNKRGMTSRALNEGGKQEHALSAQYRVWSEATASAYPRVSAVLLSISRSYKHDARREDDDAERSDLTF